MAAIVIILRMEKKTKWQEEQESKLFGILVLFGAVFLIGVVFYHAIEDLSLVEAIYFTAMTLTTVGYGDISPSTDVSKLFTSVYAFVGVGLFLGVAAVLFSSTLHRFQHHHSQELLKEQKNDEG